MSKTDYITTILAIVAMIACLAAMFHLAGCSHALEVKVGVDLDDKCLLLFPTCTSTGYRCENETGAHDLDCRVACVAGRELFCDPDGPVCTQRVGDDEPWVPVVCVSRVP